MITATISLIFTQYTLSNSFLSFTLFYFLLATQLILFFTTSYILFKYFIN